MPAHFGSPHAAYIKANGKVLAEIHGGIYDFVDPDELERILESRRGGAAGALATRCQGGIDGGGINGHLRVPGGVSG